MMYPKNGRSRACRERGRTLSVLWDVQPQRQLWVGQTQLATLKNDTRLPASHEIPRSQFKKGHNMIIVFSGIDGAGKSSAARALAVQLGPSMPVRVLGNYSGRRSITAGAKRLGIAIPPRLLDAVETLVRVVNVLTNHVKAARFDGVVLMDRHLHCQLALRAAHGVPRGVFLPWLISLLPTPDAILFFDVPIDQAHARVTARGADSENRGHLAAFRQGYLDLPEAAGSTPIDAGATAPEVLARIGFVVEALNLKQDHSEQSLREDNPLQV